MRDWTLLKAWATKLQSCPPSYQMPADVVRLTMDDLLAVIRENEELRKEIARSAKGWKQCLTNR